MNAQIGQTEKRTESDNACVQMVNIRYNIKILIQI